MMTAEELFTQVAFLQFEIATGDPAANFVTVERLLAKCQPPKGSLVVLPELWATGFAVNDYTAMAAATPEILEKLEAICAGSGLVVAGSLLEPAGDDPRDKPWNTMFVVAGNGVLGRYRKQHLFPLWQEEEVLSAGNRPAPIATPAADLGPLVCYDLRFGDLARHHASLGAPLLVVSAQWPESRVDHWRILLRARAIENQVFVVACNSCGRAGKTILAGHSMVIAPDGRILAEAGNGEEGLCVPLDPTELLELRHRFCSVGERPWLHSDSDKICTLAALSEKVHKIRRQSSRVVFTNGCFDLLHSGHVSYLEHARRAGDFLIVGVNSDRSVRALKGADRPVNSEQDRQRVLAALGCVDFVVLFDEDTPHRLITTLMPDVLVKGADWPEDEIVGAAEVKAAGGRVVRVGFEHQCSTTAIIDKIQQ
ncbi:MAG TPA: D-glycero-beta-D-manno-heptose 1-phosphate adenylyltransferase [Desulfobulbaceae bacterium]|nr:D-glycero-beta-D-manno-heptose 1-phosphate adenylyltransferase [Desulfobulbaceae bacterium]